MNLLAYVRVSRVAGRGGDAFISPDVQRERIASFAHALGHTISDVLVDLDESGGKIERPAFEQALAACEAGHADGVIVYKLDRFARTVRGAHTALGRLEAAGAHLLSVSDNLDTSSPVGRFARTMMLAIAELELERITEGWQTARGRAIARGVHIGSVVPTGYRRSERGRLVPGPDAGRITAAFELRAAGATISDVGRHLGMSKQAAASILANRVYLGEIRHGEHENRSAHEPLVGAATFEAAQRVKAAMPGRGGTASLLAGLLRCAGCRYAMSIGYAAGTHRYRCTRCGERAGAQASHVEPLVVAAFLERYGVELRSVAEGTGELELEAAVEQAAAELAAYVSNMRATDPGYRAGYEQRADELNEARRQLAAFVRALPAMITPAGWQGMTVADQRQLLHDGLEAVFVRKGREPIAERVRFVWAGDDVPELPKRGNRGNMLGPLAA